jgi:hypothetical protein
MSFLPLKFMNKLSVFTFIFTLLFTFSVTKGQEDFEQSEKKEPLKLEYVQDDIEGIAVLLKLTPIENQNIEKLKKQLPAEWYIDEDENLGFGANRFRFGKGYGYSSVYVDVLTYNNQIAYYSIGVIGSFSKWNQYREQIIKAWIKNRGPAFIENGHEMTYEKKFENVFNSYYRKVAQELGELKSVDISAELKEPYEYLTSPLNNSYIGEGICGLGGPVLEGKTSIDALIDANRIDLIENVLRGYNPGGRIFAAITLLKMEKKGIVLNSELKKTLNKVIALDIPVSICSGCIVNGGLKTKDVVKRFVNNSN